MVNIAKIKQKEVLDRIRKRSADIVRKAASEASVYLVVDCSGSMAGQKLTQAKKGAVDFAEDARRKGYSVGLIRFSSIATHLCEPQGQISVLNRYLRAMDANGSTNMTDAILLALQNLRDRKEHRAMVVVTDGMPDSPSTALESARQAKANGIDILTIGTDDADRDFLAKLASRTGLAVKVAREQLGQGIASMAKMLPGRGGDKK